MTAAAVGRVAAACAAAALRAAPLDVPSSRALSCRRARRDSTVVHLPSSSPPAASFPPTPTVALQPPFPPPPPAACAARLRRDGDARLSDRRLRLLRLLPRLRHRLLCRRRRGRRRCGGLPLLQPLPLPLLPPPQPCSRTLCIAARDARARALVAPRARILRVEERVARRVSLASRQPLSLRYTFLLRDNYYMRIVAGLRDSRLIS